MTLLLSLLAPAALAAEAPEPPPDPLELELEVRRLGQARELRTAGVVASIAGPPVAVVGLGVLVAGSLALDEEAAVTGFIIGTVGALASVTGPCLLLGGGHVARAVARRQGLEPVDSTLGWVSGGLFVGSVGAGLLFVSVAPEFLWVPVLLYAGGVATGWVWTNGSIRHADTAPIFAVHPSYRPASRGEPARIGLVVTGRF